MFESQPALHSWKNVCLQVASPVHYLHTTLDVQPPMYLYYSCTHQPQTTHPYRGLVTFETFLGLADSAIRKNGRLQNSEKSCHISRVIQAIEPDVSVLVTYSSQNIHTRLCGSRTLHGASYLLLGGRYTMEAVFRLCSIYKLWIACDTSHDFSLFCNELLSQQNFKRHQTTFLHRGVWDYT